MRTLCAALLGVTAVAVAVAQQMPTFQSSTQLVVEAVSVIGKNGKPVEGLTARDFTVTEDGVPQTIRFSLAGAQFGLPDSANPMRSLQTALRMRF